MKPEVGKPYQVAPDWFIGLRAEREVIIIQSRPKDTPVTYGEYFVSDGGSGILPYRSLEDAFARGPWRHLQSAF